MYIMNNKVFYNIKNISCIFVSGKKGNKSGKSQRILISCSSGNPDGKGSVSRSTTSHPHTNSPEHMIGGRD